MVLTDRITDLVRRKPGMTERELAEELFGETGYQQRVNSDCRLLIARGVLKRSGKGGPGDPYTYRVAR